VKRALCILGLSGLVGCAAAHKPPPTAAIPAAYTEAPSSALVFDFPADCGLPHPELARANREPATFMGFYGPTIESYITATDTISTELGDFHTQESVVVRSGTRQR
jgi:hypothetical protein